TITRDGVAVRVNAVLWFRADSPMQVVTAVEDWRAATVQAAETALRDAIGQSDLDHMLKDRASINERLQQLLREASLKWGVEIDSVEIKDVDIPEQMQRAIAKEAEAIREKRARIIRAEGEQEAALKLSQAAETIGTVPAALELRRLQTLSEIGVEHNTTIVAMLPVELVHAARKLAGMPPAETETGGAGCALRRNDDARFEPPARRLSPRDSSRGAEARTAHPRWTLVACILASSLSFVEGSVLSVALPAIRASYGAGAQDVQWVVNAYLLPLSALLLLGGALGDHFGRRRLLVIGTAIFAVTSLICALAPSLPILLAARAAQGVGAALLLPNSLALLNAAFQGEKRGRAVGIWAAAGAAAAAIAPLIGGWLVDNVGWPAIFYINLPLALGAIALAL